MYSADPQDQIYSGSVTPENPPYLNPESVSPSPNYSWGGESASPISPSPNYSWSPQGPQPMVLERPLEPVRYFPKNFSNTKFVPNMGPVNPVFTPAWAGGAVIPQIPALETPMPGYISPSPLLNAEQSWAPQKQIKEYSWSSNAAPARGRSRSRSRDMSPENLAKTQKQSALVRKNHQARIAEEKSKKAKSPKNKVQPKTPPPPKAKKQDRHQH